MIDEMMTHLVHSVVDGVELAGGRLGGERPVAVGPLLLLAHHHVPLQLALRLVAPGAQLNRKFLA